MTNKKQKLELTWIGKDEQRERKRGLRTMGKVIRNQPHQKLFENIKALLHEARKAIARNINTAMVMTYFEIGRMIVEHEQKGERRAEYAQETLKSLSQNLTSEFGRGFSVDNLQRMRSFYLIYRKYATLSRISAKQIPQAVSAKFSLDRKSETLSRISPAPFNLSWSHFLWSSTDRNKRVICYKMEGNLEGDIEIKWMKSAR